MTAAGYPQELIYFIACPYGAKAWSSLLHRNFSFRRIDDIELELGSRLNFF
jgi:hypothetical protein